jgi:hypothetical protein
MRRSLSPSGEISLSASSGGAAMKKSSATQRGHSPFSVRRSSAVPQRVQMSLAKDMSIG